MSHLDPSTRTDVGMPVWAGAGLDAAAVLVFAAIGRASHEEGWSIGGVLLIAWPFLAGSAVGWGVVRLRSARWPLSVGPGIPVLVGAVAIGMAVRSATGQGTAPSFVAVAAVVLAVLLLGWRALASRRRTA